MGPRRTGERDCRGLRKIIRGGEKKLDCTVYEAFIGFTHFYVSFFVHHAYLISLSKDSLVSFDLVIISFHFLFLNYSGEYKIDTLALQLASSKIKPVHLF